jgi:hypothetical protein
MLVVENSFTERDWLGYSRLIRLAIKETKEWREVFMAKAEIIPGNCGFTTMVETKMDGDVCKIAVKSECKAIQKLALELAEVDPYKEISFRRNNIPLTLQMGSKYCTHAACPVPVGIIKAIEVEAGMTLPTDVVILLSKD